MHINRDDLDNFPFHDSDILDINISYHKNGNVDVALKICSDINELGDKFNHIVSSNGVYWFKMVNCISINANFCINISKNDEIDFIADIGISSENKAPILDSKDWMNLHIKFISGSFIHCITNNIQILGI